MSLSFTSDPGSDRTYGTGDTTQVTVTFSENVTVTGTPQLELNMSGSDQSVRQASYSSSNSSGTIVVFEYTVVVCDRASDGLEIKANKLTLNGGTIQDASGNNAVLTHSNFLSSPITSLRRGRLVIAGAASFRCRPCPVLRHFRRERWLPSSRRF